MNKNKAILRRCKGGTMSKRLMIISIVAYRPEELGEPGKQRIANKVFQEYCELPSDGEAFGRKKLDNMFPKPTWKHADPEVVLSQDQKIASAELVVPKILPDNSALTESAKTIMGSNKTATEALSVDDQVRAIIEPWWQKIFPNMLGYIPAWNAMPQYRLTLLWDFYCQKAKQELAACKEICGTDSLTKSSVQTILAELIGEKATPKQIAANKPVLTPYQQMAMDIAMLAGDLTIDLSQLV